MPHTHTHTHTHNLISYNKFCAISLVSESFAKASVEQSTDRQDALSQLWVSIAPFEKSVLQILYHIFENSSVFYLLISFWGRA